MKKFVALFVLAIALFASVGIGTSEAATWPSARTTLILHSAAGAGGDIMLRSLARFIETKGNFPAIVENVTGASGANAWNRVARSKPDGTTLLGVSSTLIASPLQNNIPLNYTSFDPVARLFIDPVCVYTGGDSPYKTLGELLEAAEKRPGELTMTGGTPGNIEFVAARGLMRETGVDIPIVPFEGGGEGVVAVIGGHINAGIGEYAEMVSSVEGGKVRILATFNKIPGLDIPTIEELGYKTKVEKFRGIMVPKGTPQDIKDAIFDVLKQAMEDPAFKEYYTNNHLLPALQDGDTFYKFMEQQNEDVKASLAGN
ncbi:MAG: tripartite tricarboxylate transporter substrate binding protein [Synergistaceae bacterium]|jgi:tripartite-type tricarboxylate transporter receptor subunit TctC|nr:tripartite tricarboxylate transporter substrate binding protein [Synergistaceae bacterium]